MSGDDPDRKADQGWPRHGSRERCAEMRDHLAEARDLLCLANRKGIRIPEEVLGVVVRADRACAERGSIDLDLETSFWHAYGILRRTIQPATRARTYYRAVFYAALAAMLVFQCYFLFGSRVHEQLEQLRSDRIQLMVDQQLPPEEGTESLRRSLEIGAQLTQNERKQEAYRGLALLLVPYADTDVAPAAGLDAGVDRENDIETALAALRMNLDFLAAYLLPALYGLLGACALVLRKLASDLARNVSEHRSPYVSSVRYSLRLNIGVLAGLAVGWFVDPTQEGSVVANLSPLALAFVAGYGSDLVFAMMDRIVNAFTGESSQAAAGQETDRHEAAPASQPAASAPSSGAAKRRSGRRTGNGAHPGAGAPAQSEPAPA